MKSKTTHKTPAIVLRTFNYGESDLIVTFYSADFGKIKGIAKGARRSKRRFVNTLEPFACSTIIFTKRDDASLLFLENSDIINHYSGIRADLEKTLAASYLIDLVDQFTVEGKMSRELFSLVEDFLSFIDQNPTADALMRSFEMRLLKHSGYDPVFDRCTVCDKRIDDIQACRFFFRSGGIRCEACCSSPDEGLPISIGTIKTLLMGKNLDISKLHRLNLSAQTEEESGRLLAGFIRYLLGKELKSAGVLNEIKRISRRK